MSETNREPSHASPIRVGVVGTGALGRHHVRLYAELAREGLVELVGVYDVDRTTAQSVAQQHGTRVFDSFEALADAAEAVSVVTPTVTHFDLTRQLLDRGRHVLVEKPMTDTAERAQELARLACEKQCVLQVGHVERFNPVFAYLQQVATNPRFIEVHRLSPYPRRSTDIGVVLDLMIHDLDVVLAFVRSPVVSIDAVGVPVLSEAEDIANARLRFANGCVANVTASRISPESMRKIRVFSGGPSPSYISLDYKAQSGYLYRLARAEEKPSSKFKMLLAGRDSTIVSEFAGKRIVREPVPIARDEPLKLELRHFIQCVQARQTPVVSGESARQVLEVAFEITRQIRNVVSDPNTGADAHLNDPPTSQPTEQTA